MNHLIALLKKHGLSIAIACTVTSIPLVAFALTTLPLSSNFDSGKTLKSSDLKALSSAISEMQDRTWKDDNLYNNFYGLSAGSVVAGGYSNNAFGARALAAVTTGNGNTAIGQDTLRHTTTGENNTAVGNQALVANTTSHDNTAVGYDSMIRNTEGSENTAVGTNALLSLTTGWSNSAFGDGALGSNTTGYQNVAVGEEVLSYSGIGSQNTAVGYFALGNRTPGNPYYDVALGFQAGLALTSGWNNVIIGPNVGSRTLSTGSYNLLIGVADTVDTPAPDTNNYLNIKNIITSTGTDVPSNSNTTIAGRLNVNGDVTVKGSAVTCTVGNGSSATSCSASDQRLKTNIKSLDASTSLAAIETLKPISFNWNSWMQRNGSATTTQFGFIAQDVQKVFPNLVSEDPNSHYLKLDYQGLFAPLVSAIREIVDVSGVFRDHLIAWLGDASNGIESIFAGSIHAQKEVCIGQTCVNETELKALLAKEAGGGSK